MPASNKAADRHAVDAARADKLAALNDDSDVPPPSLVAAGRSGSAKNVQFCEPDGVGSAPGSERSPGSGPPREDSSSDTPNPRKSQVLWQDAPNPRKSQAGALPRNSRAFNRWLNLGGDPYGSGRQTEEGMLDVLSELVDEEDVIHNALGQRPPSRGVRARNRGASAEEVTAAEI